MENRDRDKMSSNVEPTSEGNVKSQKPGKKQSDVDFGKKIGRSEELEKEPSRRSGSEIGSTGQSSPSGSRSQSGSMGSSGSDRRPSGGRQ